MQMYRQAKDIKLQEKAMSYKRPALSRYAVLRDCK
jgi:hypothetical protein